MRFGGIVEGVVLAVGEIGHGPTRAVFFDELDDLRHQLMPRVFAISSSMRVGIYDCVYVALAEREGCEFITADDKLIKNLQSKFPFVISPASMP